MHVRVLPQGEQIEVEADESILDAALRTGLNLPHSCKAGHCGSCVARLLRGSVRYPGPRPPALSEEEERDGRVLLCQARPCGPVSVETRRLPAVRDIQIRSMPCRIERMSRLTADVMGLWLRPPSFELFEWQPGQYLDVMLSGGRRRSFSIASPPHAGPLLELHVRHSAGGEFTGQVFGSMTEGTLLRIEGPLGQLAYRAGTGPMFLLAGGTGFAPMKAILRHVLETGLQRKTVLFWGARRESDLYEHSWLREIAVREPTFTYLPVLSEGGPRPGYESGLLHEAVLASGEPLTGADIYAAGPPEMIAAVRDALPRRGADPARIVFDSFEYAPDALARMVTGGGNGGRD